MKKWIYLILYIVLYLGFSNYYGTFVAAAKRNYNMRFVIELKYLFTIVLAILLVLLLAQKCSTKFIVICCVAELGLTLLGFIIYTPINISPVFSNGLIFMSDIAVFSLVITAFALLKQRKKPLQQ